MYVLEAQDVVLLEGWRKEFAFVDEGPWKRMAEGRGVPSQVTKGASKRKGIVVGQGSKERTKVSKRSASAVGSQGRKSSKG